MAALTKVYYDLHIHTCLSPCGDAAMTPTTIVGMAKLGGLDIIAVSDHNSCKNLPAVFKAAEEYEMTVVAGMELCTAEEIHVLCLFPSLESAMKFDFYVEAHLIKVENNEAIFGRQSIVNENDEETGVYPYLLTNATDIGVNDVAALVLEYGGVAIPAHLDRDSYSLLAVLGFLEKDMNFATIEIFDLEKRLQVAKFQPELLTDYNIISSSDAHYLENLRERECTVELLECTAQALIDFLKQPPGRQPD